MVKTVYLLLMGLLLLRIGSFYYSWKGEIFFPRRYLGVEEKTGFFALRSKLTEIYFSVLPLEHANLLSGIVLGKRGLNAEFRDKLTRTGLSHVVAASGMNVTFFASGVMAVLRVLKTARYIKICLASVLIGFYASLTGFDPPIVRAVIMAEIIFLANLTGRQNTGWGALCLAAYLMLWVSPDLLVSPSFLLSFSAMASQVFLSALLDYLPKNRLPIIELGAYLVGQSVLVFLFTLPIVVIFFTNFSLISLISNPLVLWTIEPIMILGVAIASFGLFFTPISQALALPAQGILEYFLLVVDFLAKSHQRIFHYSFPSANLAIIFAIVYYLVLFLLVRRTLAFVRYRFGVRSRT